MNTNRYMTNHNETRKEDCEIAMELMQNVRSDLGIV